MMIAMLIAFTIGGQNFERYEPMPNLATCWQRAPERMNALLAALFAPKGTPKEIIDRLNAAAVQALADPAARSRLADLGVEILPRERQTPEAFGALQKADAAKWWPLIKEFGIKAE
jgi:tripartite-type tricarboxylate transporter receptor subunit TctC